MEKFTGPERTSKRSGASVSRSKTQSTRATSKRSANTWPRTSRSSRQLKSYGRADVIDATAEAYDAYELDERFHIDTIVVAGDLAVEHGTYELTMTPKDGGDPLHADGLPYVYVDERSQEDDWQVLRMSWQTA